MFLNNPNPGRLSHGAEKFLAQLAHQPAVLVRVASTQGSVPRETGAWMAVFASAVVGTIGGGQLEHQAIVKARAGLQASCDAGLSEGFHALERFALGPSLGQCCGGVMHLRFDAVSASDASALASSLRRALAPVALFGAGHVGHALVRVLAPLPFQITWIDSRADLLFETGPAGVACEHSDPPQAAVAALAPQSRVLIMSFSHAEDFDVVAACLRRLREQADLPFIGLIGSSTKWATFHRRLLVRGFTFEELAQVICPIGVLGIAGKEPEVIAVAVAAQLLQTLS